MRRTPFQHSNTSQMLVDWRSGITSWLGAQLGGGATGSIPRSGVCFSGGVNVCVYGLCMGFGVHTALLAFRQLSSITEGFKPCWKTGQSANLETILFYVVHDLQGAMLWNFHQSTWWLPRPAYSRTNWCILWLPIYTFALFHFFIDRHHIFS